MEWNRNLISCDNLSMIMGPQCCHFWITFLFRKCSAVRGLSFLDLGDHFQFWEGLPATLAPNVSIEGSFGFRLLYEQSPDQAPQHVNTGEVVTNICIKTCLILGRKRVGENHGEFCKTCFSHRFFTNSPEEFTSYVDRF